jgi:hypothetical protein
MMDGILQGKWKDGMECMMDGRRWLGERSLGGMKPMDEGLECEEWKWMGGKLGEEEEQDEEELVVGEEC